MDVGAWLRGLGLGQYEAAFAENEIDAKILPDITAEDLKEIGVVAVGHRRRILAAAARLGASTGPAAATEVVERRQLTVMFGDLVGSTALSARLDPEDMRLVIIAYQDACSGVVARYDGFVARFLGDGILAYFGFPHAHEDDAARAVHAGLEIVEAVARLQTRARQKLAVRVGIATGLVVVGDLVGEGSAQEQAVVGDTPNLAARLQGLAEAGGVVVAGSTRRLLDDRFRLRDLGKHVVKGLAEPVEAWAALGVSESESRFEAAHSTRLTGFVGREAESAVLIARQRRAWAGEGQVVLISGEAGIGKSRISAWLADQVGDTPHAKLRYQCSPYHRDSALYPFVQQFERAAGITPQEDPQTKLEKLETALGLARDRMNEVAPLIASVLSIPFGKRYPPLDLSAAQQRHRTLEALLDHIEDLARKQPVLMLFEDAHWADATSLEVLDLGIERLRRLPVLLLMTYRPEFEAPWTGQPAVATIVLQRLDRADAETLVERVAGGRRLPAEVLAQIVAKTDGVPLFVEELTKNVLESGLLREDGERWRLDGPLPPLAIPSTLQDSLMARLDRLAAVKEIAQVGAAIGREFTYPLLHAVADRGEATLRAALAQLEESELVFRSGEPPAARYAFKHALVQDTAYESLLKSRRQILHQRIAETLREKFAEVVDAEPELLAHHFTRAGLIEPAIEYWGKAGDLALRRSAFKEAIAHLGKAIEMTEAAGSGDEEWTNRRLKLQVAFSAAYMFAQGHGAPETAAAFERVRELARGAEDARERFTANFGLWVGSNVRGELGPMRDLAESLLRDGANRPKSREACVAHGVNSATHFFAGEFVAAREHAQLALAAFDRQRDRDLAFPFGLGAGVSATIYSALALWPLGELESAERSARDSLALAAHSTQHSTVAFGLLHAAWFESIKRNPVGVAHFAAEGSRVAQQHNLSLWANVAPFFEGWSEARLGGEKEGLARMRRSKANWRALGLNANVPLFETLTAEIECELGEIEAAVASIDLALRESARAGQRWFDAESHRIRGQILLRQNPDAPAAAEQSFLIAIAIAQHQKARSFELRAALDLARLYRARRRDADAYAALGPALEGFSPMPEFPEVAEAKALLEALGQSAEVKAATASRSRRTQLQISLGNALFAARGPSAPETTAAFAKARELAKGNGDATAKASIAYGLWVRNYIRGDLAAMRELAGQFSRDVEGNPDSPEAAVAQRIHGGTLWFEGDYLGARAHYERALAMFERMGNRDRAYRFGQDQFVATEILLATVLWPLGEVDEAARLTESAHRHAREGGQISTLAYHYNWASGLQLLRDDLVRAIAHVDALEAISREHDLASFAITAALFRSWIDWRRGGDASPMRERLAQLRGSAFEFGLRPLGIDLAIARDEANAGRRDAAIAMLDEIVVDNERRGQHWLDAEDYRARGEILASFDPIRAEEALLTAIAIARRQQTRSFELRAALSLTRLYGANGRDADALAVLRPALVGFSPTPEFPEIAEARVVFEKLNSRCDEAAPAKVSPRVPP